MQYTLNIVSISQTTKLLLSGSIPCVEADLAEIGVECDRVDYQLTLQSSLGKKKRAMTLQTHTFNTESGDVFLLKFASKMSFDKSRLLY